MKGINTVLLVDDDETTNFLNKFFIKQLDSELNVETVSNGKEAIDFIQANKGNGLLPALIILDTNMPVMNGWDFLDAFQDEFDESVKDNTVVVMLTALETEEAVGRAMAHSCVTDTAQKPLSDLKFRVLINKHFQ